MSILPLRRLRPLCVFVVAVVTAGPYAPVAFCAVSDLIAPAVAPTMPCHGDQETPKGGAHDCCDDVVDSCCLQSADTVAMAGPALERLDHADLTIVTGGALAVSDSDWHRVVHRGVDSRDRSGSSDVYLPLRL